MLSGLHSLPPAAGYPAVKARYLLGLFAFTEESYQEAIDHFNGVYQMGKNTYFQSLALANAAASAENMGDIQRALEYYTRIIDEFGFEAAESPKALFAQGRLEEGRGNTDLAKGRSSNCRPPPNPSTRNWLESNRILIENRHKATRRQIP